MIVPQGRLPRWLMRIGLTMEIDSTYNNILWYGRGPQENYPDRKQDIRLDNIAQMLMICMNLI